MGFLEETRQNIRPVGSINYVPGGQGNVILPRVGYLARLHVHVSGTMTIVPGASGTHVLSERGPWNILRRLRIKANQGQDIFSLDGFECMVADVISTLGHEPEDGQTAAPFAAQIYNAPVASGANAWELGFVVPITPNERDIAGLILLQTEGLQAEVVAEFAQPGGATHLDFPVVLGGTATCSFVGTVEVTAETFSMPVLEASNPDITTLWQTLSKVDAISTQGDNAISLLRANAYARVVHIVTVNGLLNTDDVDQLELRYNRSESPYTWTRKQLLQRQRRMYGRDLPKGVFVHDLFYQGFPGFGAGRDLVDGFSVAELESIVRIRTGATLGTGNNRITTLTQQFVNLA